MVIKIKNKIFERKQEFSVSNITVEGQLLRDRKIKPMLNDREITREFLEEGYYKRKNTLQQIAAEFNTHIFSVARLIDKYGLKRRNHSEATYKEVFYKGRLQRDC